MTNIDALIATLRKGEPIAIAGALFDMDGTLVDSIPAVESAWDIWAKQLEFTMPLGDLHGKTARAVVEATGIAVDRYEEAERLLSEIECRPGQVLDSLPGALELVTSIPAGRWGLVTSAASEVATVRLGATDLPSPEFRVTGSDVSASKPAPEPFEKGVRILRDRGHDGPVLAFEDTIAGATSARDAGCLVLGVPGTVGTDQLGQFAHIVLDSLADLRVTVTDGALHAQLRSE